MTRSFMLLMVAALPVTALAQDRPDTSTDAPTRDDLTSLEVETEAFTDLELLEAWVALITDELTTCNETVAAQDAQLEELDLLVATLDLVLEAHDAIIEDLEATLRVATTGVTTCYDNVGAEIDCAVLPGQDGDEQAGMAPPPDRFVDNGDGTVTDTWTKLVWLQDLDCLTQGGALLWADAITAAHQLHDGDCGLTDGSWFGSWRVPNIREYLSLVDYSHFDGIAPGHPFTISSSGLWTWTSTTRPNGLDCTGRIGCTPGGSEDALVFGLNLGMTEVRDKDGIAFRAWAVRDPLWPGL